MPTTPLLAAHFQIELSAPLPVLSVSDDIESLLGYSAEDFRSGRVLLKDRIHAADQDIADTLFAPGAAETGSVNLRLRQTNGRIRCVRGEFTKTMPTSGGPALLDLQLQDAKSLPRTLAEAALTPSLRAMMENTDDFIFFKDRNHVFTGASQTLVSIAESIEHWTELIGKTDYDVLPEEFADSYYALEKQIFSGLPVAQEIQQFLRTDGRQGWVDNRKHAIRNEAGEIVGLYGIARDVTARKLTEDAIAGNEHLLRTVIDEMPDVLVVKDYKGDFLLANRTVAQLYGTTPDAMVGKHDGDFGVPQEMADFFRASVLGIMALGKTEIVFEDSRDAESGEVRHFKSIKKPFKNAAGENQILVIAQDITDVIRIQEKVAQSERRLQEILDVTHEGIWDWHIPSGQVFHNDRWYKILGAEIGELPDTADAFFDLIHPDDKALVRSRIGGLLHGAANDYRSEHRMRSMNGEYFWVQDRGNVVERDATGKPVRIVGSFFNINDKRLAEQALRDSEERLRLAISASNQGLYDIDLTTGEAVVSPEYARMLGYEPEEFHETNAAWRERLHPDDQASVYGAYEHYIAGRIPDYRVEFRQRTKSGGWVWILSVGQIQGLSADGKPARMLGTHTDITARKHAEAELHAYQTRLERMVDERTTALLIAKDAAESASRAKSTFLANMSHELRTPMSQIMGMTSLALMETTDPKLADRLSKIDLASQRLLNIITDILDISRIEAERLVLDHVSLSPGAILVSLNTPMRQKADDRGLQFIIEESPDVSNLALMGDPARLGQILLNLASNAIKFTHTGGVTVRTRLVENNPADVVLRFEVQDTGIGISADDLKRLFVAFEQADASSTRSYGGAGLGLVICKRLARMMGGDIAVTSQPGKGSLFALTVRLSRMHSVATDGMDAPSARRNDPDIPETADQAGAHLKAGFAGTRVLLAEDEATNQLVTQAIIESAGLIVDIAVDGQQAVMMAKNTPYAVIMIAPKIPMLNGADAARAIRLLPGYAQTPILAMSAAGDWKDCRNAGMNDRIEKPVVPNRLYQVLLKWLA